MAGTALYVVYDRLEDEMYISRVNDVPVSMDHKLDVLRPSPLGSGSCEDLDSCERQRQEPGTTLVCRGMAWLESTSENYKLAHTSQSP